MRLLTYSLPAGRVMGIPLRINWILLLFIPFFIGRFVPDLRTSGGVGWIMLLLGTLYVVILYGSILLHELGHAWGMRLVGESCHEIQLTPLGGIAFGGGGNHSPRTELLVVGLGPAVSALLALTGWIGSELLGRFGWGQSEFYSYFVVTSAVDFLYGLNLMLFLFNVFMPIFPLDSAKLLRALLSLRFDPQKTTYYVANLGVGLGVMVLFAWIMGISLPFIGRGSGILFLIALLGIQACLYELRALEFNDVYTAYDKWSTRPIYFDSEIMERAWRYMREDLGPLGRLIPGGGGKRRAAPATGKRKSRPAAPVFKSRSAPPSSRSARPEKEKTTGTVRLVVPDPESLTDPEEVRTLMEAAAEAEDFALAARLKRRLRELSGG